MPPIYPPLYYPHWTEGTALSFHLRGLISNDQEHELILCTNFQAERYLFIVEFYQRIEFCRCLPLIDPQVWHVCRRRKS